MTAFCPNAVLTLRVMLSQRLARHREYWYSTQRPRGRPSRRGPGAVLSNQNIWASQRDQIPALDPDKPARFNG